MTKLAGLPILILLSLVLAVTLSPCGGAAEPATEAPAPTAAPPTAAPTQAEPTATPAE